MNNNRLNIQMFSILAIVIAAFAGSAILFSYLNTDSIKQTVETETSMTAVLLTSTIQEELEKTAAVTEGGQASSSEETADDSLNLDEDAVSQLTDVISSVNNAAEENLDIWLVNSSFDIMCANMVDDEYALEDLISISKWHELRKKTVVKGSGEGQSVLLWVGERSFFVLRQRLLLVRPVVEGELYLVMLNRGLSIHEMQRRHFTLFAWIEAILMVAMIVVLVNTLFNYRKQLIRLATKDELTGLSNRKSFNEAYREFIKNTVQNTSDKFTVLLIDIDFFKQINDTYGHAAGDLALRTLAGYIGRMTKRYGGFAGRWGGDEFIGVLSTTGEEAHEAVRELCHLVRAARMEGDVRITISVGAVEADRSTSPELAHLTELADLALYVSKENGRNRYNFYTEDMKEEPHDKPKSKPPVNADTHSAPASEENTPKKEEEKDREEGKQEDDSESISAKSREALQVKPQEEEPQGNAESKLQESKPQEKAESKPQAEKPQGNAESKPQEKAETKPEEAPEEDEAGKAVSSMPEEGGQRSGGLLGRTIKSFIDQRLIGSILLGVKWMAPFVAGGGLLIGLAFLFDASLVDLSSLSVAERTALGSITPLASSLKSIGDSTFNFMLPVFAGFMAYGLAGESAFLSGFVGGFMTIQSNAGFIGAMIAGLAAGIIASEIKEFIGRMPRVVQKAAPIVIFPVFNLVLMYVIANLVITPIASAMGAEFTHVLDILNGLDIRLAGAVAGGMMAVDMGGIINKVAYNYGVSGLTLGRTNLMASVMAGGMVPPIGIALSLIRNKKLYSPEDRDRTASTLFMGLSFITEGALPFVFKDFIHVIPSCIVGSAFAGMLSALFGCQLPAPHGGVFVLPVMTRPFLYLIALAAGSAATAFLLGRSKKKEERALL